MSRFLPVSLAAVFFFFLAQFSLSQATSFHKTVIASHGQPAGQADLNGDGILDLVSPGPSDSKNGFYVVLSNPNGTYQAPVFYTSPYAGNNNVISPGDFNGDGWVDVAEVEGSKSYYIYLNAGDGTLLPSWNFATTNRNSGFLVTADFNRDGKVDLVLTSEDSTSQPHLQILFGQGDGTFATPTDIALDAGYLLIGDFDGDANADLAVTGSSCLGCDSLTRIYYGNGQGGFSAPTHINYDEEYDFRFSTDIDQDGHSDLIATSFQIAPPLIRILHGTSNRSFNLQDVTLTTEPVSVTAADLNGDGVKDLAVTERNGSQWSVNTLAGNPGGSFQPEQSVFSKSSALTVLNAGRYNSDNRPDLLSMYELDGSHLDTRAVFLRNAVTVGEFPRCRPPKAPTGIAVCSPKNGTKVISPVEFHVGAAFTSPLRKTELWIDGKKRQESFNSYSIYSFLDGFFSLSAGPHKADIHSAGYDNLLQHTSVEFTVR